MNVCIMFEYSELYLLDHILINHPPYNNIYYTQATLSGAYSTICPEGGLNYFPSMQGEQHPLDTMFLQQNQEMEIHEYKQNQPEKTYNLACRITKEVNFKKKVQRKRKT